MSFEYKFVYLQNLQQKIKKSVFGQCVMPFVAIDSQGTVGWRHRSVRMAAKARTKWQTINCQL